MDRRTLMSPDSAQASDIFDKFCSANTLKAILSHYRQLCNLLRLQATHFPDFYPRLKSKLCSWRAQGLWTKFEKRASHKSYSRGKSCAGCRVLIIGAGPCGLRTAIEAQLLGAKVVLIEKRDRFSRNNVLHLWPFVITDLKALGAKKFYGKFCAGSIDHISIRQLQCILLKVALLLGVEVHEGVGFEGLYDPTENEGWRAITSPIDHPVSQYHFDCLIGADGRRNTLDGFKRKALRAKLAIAITANFINKRTEAEARVKEISGVSYIFNQKFFQDLNEATGIDLENIVYYKDETHYFVMTAKKHSLLQKGVLLHDYADTAKLLSHENISTDALMIYAIEAAIFSTENQLPNLEFAVNHYGQPDVAMFDFTAMYAAENACRVVQRKGHKLMMTLVGDSLLEPFWPTGSGCARGFLSCFDACWMLRSLATGSKSLLEVIAERESIYRLLGQTTPENLNKEHVGYTIDPHSRYPNLNQRLVMPFQVQNLFDTDEKVEEKLDGDGKEHVEMEQTSKKPRRDTVIAVDSLLNWFRSQVKCYGLEIEDASDAYVSGDVLLAILHRFRPDLIEYPPTSEENVSPAEIAAAKNQIAFDVLHREYGVASAMTGDESVLCSTSDFLTIVAYLSQLYDIFKGEIPQIKYPNSDGIEDLDLEEYVTGQQYSAIQARHVRPPAVIAKHGAVAAKVVRRSRISSSSREGRNEADSSETSRRHRKRRSDERSRISSGREPRASTGEGQTDNEKQNVTGLTKHLEEKLKGSKYIEKKPKDLIRAIGKIEKSDWNVQLIEKKIAESKGHSQGKKDRDDKVPKWSREAFDDKREAMKRKMEGVSDKDFASERAQLFEETMKKLGTKLTDGSALEVGQRGCNKVSQMAEKLAHNLVKSKKEVESSILKPTVRPVFEFPKKGGSETCHFCVERVYVVERMTAEGKFFHRNCFRCEYCNTSLRLGNYSFDREGRYGDRFYCLPHFNTIRLYGWKKYDREGIVLVPDGKLPDRNMLLPQQILSEMDERGTTPERVEFENTVDFASEEELLSEMDEDEWTDRNFGASNVDNNTSDEASDLSEDDDATPEGTKEVAAASGPSHDQGQVADSKEGCQSSSDSDTEKASVEGSYEGASGDEDDDNEDDEDDCDEEEEECGGSTTEVETDSEFAEDPPQSVPGRIPTIIVDEPEQLIARLSESTPKCHAKPLPGRVKSGGSPLPKAKIPEPPKYEELKYVEPVSKIPVERGGRALPRVYPILKKWEPLVERDHSQDAIGSKISNELKKKYLHGVGQAFGAGAKRVTDPAAQSHITSVLDMISEKQKLLQPALQPSPAMQAFLDGTNKYKNFPAITTDETNGLRSGSGDMKISPSTYGFPIWPQIQTRHDPTDINESIKETIDMNRLNLEKTMEATAAAQNEKRDTEKEIPNECSASSLNMSAADDDNEQNYSAEVIQDGSQMLSDTLSQSKTSSQCTVVNAIPEDLLSNLNSELLKSDIGDSNDICSDSNGSDSETGSVEAISDLDDLDETDGENEPVPHKPPRVEIEDEFGVTLSLDPERPKTKPLLEIVLKPKTTMPDEDEPSYCMSWSDSKDSISGICLESELSDWSRIPSKASKKKKHAGPPGKLDKMGDKLQQLGNLPFDLDIASLEYADVDGMSSPDDLILSERKKLGYSKLVGDEDQNALVELEGIIQEEVYSNTSDSDRSSTSTLGSMNKKVLPAFDHNQVVGEQTEIIQAVNSAIFNPTSQMTPGPAESFPILDRVIPFSNARDSLDYRKMKSLTSPAKSKDLFSTYTVPSTQDSVKPTSAVSPVKNSSNGGLSECTKQGLKPDIVSEIQDNAEEAKRSHSVTDRTSPSTSATLDTSAKDNLNKSGASPNTVRRIDEINKERALQSDLIRSMVMGRIRRSPEKNRRGSLGSLSPIIGNSSSSTSDSGDLPKANLKPRTDGNPEADEFSRSSQDSILSQNTTGTEESLDSSGKTGRTGEEEFPVSIEGTGRSCSNFKSEENVISPLHYEPVFTSSPRFRNRPLFDSPLSIYQSVTNPPTPVNPGEPLCTPSSPITPASGNKESPCNRLRNSCSPSLYRSMPNLTDGVGSCENSAQEKDHKLNKVNSFATPDVNKWEAYKYTSTVDRENAREAARDRARLKSDEELGLSPAERYLLLKDKLRRKLSCPEWDGFGSEDATNGSINSARETSPRPTSLGKPFIYGGTGSIRSPPPCSSDVFDSVASSIRHNVSFPLKSNPFLVSPVSSSLVEFTPSKESTPLSKNKGEDSTNVRFRTTPQNVTPSRKKFPDKAKSVDAGWDPDGEPFPNYFSSSSYVQAQHFPNTANVVQSEKNWVGGMSDSKHTTPISRARANTVSELNLNQFPEQGRDIPGKNVDNSDNYVEIRRASTQGSESGNLVPPSTVNPHKNAYHLPETNALMSVKKLNKTKALSTDMLLDGSPLALAPFRGVSVPDVTSTTPDASTTVATPDRKLKKSSKDRFRRRSLIQAVSDFFISRAPSVLNSSNPVCVAENEKSSSSASTSTSPSSQPSASKDKFSIFKLTPKLLQKDKKSPHLNMKSKESLPPAPTSTPKQTQVNSNLKPTTVKSARSSFISYLSQPEMIIQKLSSSPIPFKSSRASMEALRPGSKPEIHDSGSTNVTSKETPKFKTNPNTPEARRMREAHEIQLQLESIEIEQRRLESRGVTIEKRLRGEELDDENRDDVELMEEWFTLVREKTRLARFERELIVREKELELEHKQEKIEEKLDESLLIDDTAKPPETKSKELEMWHELQSLERQRGLLLSQFHEDMQKYETEDADLEAKIASSSMSPRESNV